MSPSNETQALEMLVVRFEHLEQKVHRLENMIPRLVVSTMGMFFKAAADARVGSGTEFEFAPFEAGDSYPDSLRIARLNGGLVIYAATRETDKWVTADWIMPNSMLWNQALQYLDAHQVDDAHVKIVANQPVTEGTPDVNVQ